MYFLDKSALLDVLEILKAAKVNNGRIRQAIETIHQALIVAELTAVIGTHPHQRTESRTAQRNGQAPAADDYHHGRGPGPEDPTAAGRIVLPVSAGTPPAGGSVAVRGESWRLTFTAPRPARPMT